MDKTKKKTNKVLKIILWVIGIIILLFCVIIGGWNLIKLGVYSTYYSIKTDLVDNPGLNDNYICQGVSYIKEKNVYITSGYMTNKNEPSRIYNIDTANKSSYTQIYFSDNSICNDHFGGVAYNKNTVYIASTKDQNVYLLDLEDVLTSSKSIIKSTVKVNNNADFIFTKDNYLYVGEFNNSKQYVTNHIHKINENTTYKAIVSKYDLTDFSSNSKPIEEYAIKDKVQGFCITSSSKFVISTSWGPSFSHYYVYDSVKAKVDDYDNGIPVYYMDDSKLVSDIQGPSMAEDLDYYDGKVISLSESASNKYIYGKLLFNNKIVGLKID